MSDIITRSTQRLPSHMPTPPPDAPGAARSGAPHLGRVLARHAVTLIAVALVFVVVALLDRTVTPRDTNALPLRVVAVAGLGAAAVGTTLRRLSARYQPPAPQRRATAAPPRPPARVLATSRSQLAAARTHQRLAGGAWRRALLRTIAALGVASLMLVLVVGSPHSVPLLVVVGLTGLFTLRQVAGPPGGVTRTAAVARPPARQPAARTRQAAHARGGARPAGTADEVHDAALDGFPASDPPSPSPLHIGASTTPGHRIPAHA